MGDVTYAVNFALMEDAITDAKVRAARVKDLLESMDASTRASLDSWTGDARIAYQQAYQACMAQAEAMPATLENARATLVSIMNGYQSAEASVAGAFGK
ncbi:WXG100 family type VII secretion target [Kineosporia sp. NBRC 101731]|uniref:WXG100 family type VII secretion target n=1 Tax=Kineosporia sp. NBRC 101731 TaxID=3032199 RepID=UPI0024A500C2|nr:WXG100 family type VII secretion target [Kineosporia sp. NBRC 101731]GLY31522.1 hypothetical protein Kisp02_48870 [Kineosporia sp. NBRC 101731]